MNKFWSVRNEAENDTAELLLYGEISEVSWWGDEVTPKAFAEDLKELNGNDLTVCINSGGGDVFAAQAIYTQLKNYPGSVKVRIDGLCASAATIISCAGNFVSMPLNALYMIHNPAVGLMGYFDSNELKKMAGQVEVIKQTIVEVYKERTNLSENELNSMMNKETWFSASEAKEYGFADEVLDLKVENSIKNDLLVMNNVTCKLNKFQNVDALKNILTGKGQKKMDNELLQKIANKLGIGKQEETPAIDEAAIKAQAVKAERERIIALDALKCENSAVNAIIETAKKNGATVDDIRPYVDAIPKEEKNEAGIEEIKNLILDNLNSGANNVPSDPKGNESQEAIKRQAFLNAITNLNKKEGK